MDFNILKPKKAVEAAFEKPNIGIALILVLLPALVAIAESFVRQGAFDLEGAVSGIVLAYLAFFLLAIIIFLLGFLVNPKAVKGKAAGLLTSLSLIQIISLFVIVLSIATMPLVISSQAMEMLSTASSAPSQEIRAVNIGNFLAQNPAAINIPVLGILLAITFAAFVLGIYLIYLSVRKLTGSRKLVALLFTLIAMLILGLLPL